MLYDPFKHLDNDQLAELLNEICRDSSKAAHIGLPFECFGKKMRPPVRRLIETPELVVKSCPDFASAAQQCVASAFVAEHTTIPTPHIIRGAFSLEGRSHILMEHIDGEDLETLWPRMNIWKRFRVLMTLRSYIRQLRQINLPSPKVPGPLLDLSDLHMPRRCRGHCFSLGEPPVFSSVEDMRCWYAQRRKARLHVEGIDPLAPGYRDPLSSPFNGEFKLVYVHGDLNMRNIRVATDGTVWLLDWDFAGAYPEWFEYCGITQFSRDSSASWIRFAPIVAGWYGQEAEYLRKAIY